jgi:hypothetical protein
MALGHLLYLCKMVEGVISGGVSVKSPPRPWFWSGGLSSFYSEHEEEGCTVYGVVGLGVVAEHKVVQLQLPIPFKRVDN